MERDISIADHTCVSVNFNSHAHVERDKRCKRAYIVWKISTHTLTWSVTEHGKISTLHWIFQLTRSRGAWRRWHWDLFRFIAFQLTRSRGAWPLKSDSFPVFSHFNSHAHVERDYCPYCNGGGHDNFNSHAHVERDENNFKNANKCGNFNSHAHVERDIPRGQERQLYLISTHTLTWSVTKEWNTEKKDITDFNSHAHVERDAALMHDCGDIQISTHTLTWSVTRTAIKHLIETGDFNSHAHVERDFYFSPIFRTVHKISTHTLTWSVTCTYSLHLHRRNISTHTLTWSVTFW